MKIIRPITITDAMFTASNVPETDYSAYNAGTTYSVGDRVIITTGIHKIYESLANDNTGNYPPTDVLVDLPVWIEVSATNRWKVFDNILGDQTSQATSITYSIAPGQVFDSIAILNLDAVTARIVLTDPVDGVVYDTTIDLMASLITGDDPVYDWYSYFFSSFFKTTDVVKFNVVPYLNAVLDITITYTGGTVKCGEIVIGLQSTIGKTLYNPSIGIHDYSTKEADTFGIYKIVERAYSKKMSVDLTVQNLSIDNVQNLLAYYRASPIVWCGAEDYSSMIIYGYYKDFSTVIKYGTYSNCSIEIEGLT